MPTDMPITIRLMRPGDAAAFLAVHRAAVRALAAPAYDPAVIEAWAPLPVGETEVERLAANEAGGYRLVALSGKCVVGIAAMAVKQGELIACYVDPAHAGSGIGTALIRAIEDEARRAGLEALETDASINAEGFYAARGYQALRATTHRLSGGREMKAVRMRKRL